MINEIDTGVSDKRLSDLSLLFIDFPHFHHHPSTCMCMSGTCMYMAAHTHTRARCLFFGFKPYTEQLEAANFQFRFTLPRDHMPGYH